MVNENKLVSAGYIMNFYNDLENLNAAYPVYLNMLINYESKYGKKLEGITEQENTMLMTTANDIRSFAVKAQIRYEALEDSITCGVTLKQMEDALTKLTVNSTPERVDIKAFVVLLNKVFTSAIMGELLINSRSLITEG